MKTVVMGTDGWETPNELAEYINAQIGNKLDGDFMAESIQSVSMTVHIGHYPNSRVTYLTYSALVVYVVSSK